MLLIKNATKLLSNHPKIVVNYSANMADSDRCYGPASLNYKKLVVFAPGLVVSMQAYVPRTAELPRNFPLQLVNHARARNGLVVTSRSFRHWLTTTKTTNTVVPFRFSN